MKSISPFVDYQVPGFVKDDYPKFLAFIKAYYSFLDSHSSNGTNYISRSMMSYRDVDETTDEFIKYFLYDFLNDFPEETALDKAKLVKLSKDFYKTKGSEDSLKFLFRVLYNEEIDVYYPKKDILKASDGKWQQPQYIKLTISPANLNVNLDYLVKRLLTGTTSKSICIVESYQRSIDPINQSDVVLLFVSNIKGTFLPNEIIQIPYEDSEGISSVFIEKITGAISKIQLVKDRYGLTYNVGDPVIVHSGLDNTLRARDANAIVSQVSTGQVIAADVIDGGFGFRAEPYSLAEVIPAFGDTGAGATLSIVEVDTSKTITLNVVYDTIDTFAAVSIGDADYHFNTFVTNVNTTLATALNTTQTNFYPLKKIRVTNSGGGYKRKPSELTKTYINTDLYDVYNSFPNDQRILDFFASQENPSIPQEVKTLGMIGGVKIINPGKGYNPTTDLITLINPYGGIGYPSSITNVSQTGTVVTITTQLDHGYTGGQTVYIAGLTNTTLNGTWVISGTPTTNSFTFTKTTATIPYTSDKGQAFIPSITYSVNGAGSIVSVSIDDNNRGWGYYTAPEVVIKKLDGTASQGTGANLQAFILGTGEYVDLTVDGIGKVQGIKLTDLGFDYIHQPLVSLRVMDIVLNPVANSTIFTPNTQVYQGASIDQASFIATIRSFNPTNSTLRVYEYQGGLDVAANLRTLSANTDPVSFVKYGDGLAEATAIFKGGVIEDKGFYLNDDGFLSAGKVLQDSKRYHNFSYVVKVKKALSSYKSALLKVFHPSGMSLLSEYDINSYNPIVSKSSTQFRSSKIRLNSSIAMNSALQVGNVIGTNTNFTSYSSNASNCMVVITQGGRILTPKINSITNNTFLIVESNLKFFGTGTLSTHAGSPTVYISDTQTSDEIQQGDVLRVNINNSDIFVSVAGPLVSGSFTSNVTFATSNSSIYYEVYPSINTAVTGSYTILNSGI